jgi:hypothetical protein
MTTIQIVSLIAVGAVLLISYMPSIKWPVKQTSSMSQIEAVLTIRDNATSPEVRSACSQLLSALLQ